MLLQQSKQILNLESELKKIRENECLVQNRFAETDQLIHNVEANLKKTLDEISINIQRQLSSFEDSLISKMYVFRKFLNIIIFIKYHGIYFL